jgi:hypothetical protein
MALLLAGNTKVECVSKPDRVALISIAMISRIQIFCDEIGFKLPSEADVRQPALILIHSFVRRRICDIVNRRAVAGTSVCGYFRVM